MLANLRREERIGLAIAAALHAALVLAFLLQPDNREDIEPTQRMTVNLASEVGLEAAAPEPVAESRAAVAPTLSDEPAPALQPTPQPRLERPVAASIPQPADARPRRRPDRVTPPKPVKKTGGGSRIGADFLPGSGDSTKTTETRVPASAIGANAKASIIQAISRQLKPKWQGRAPDGPDSDKLVTILAFNLNEDGSLNGSPRVVRQVTNDLNRNQAALHAEAAIRAVRLAAPFDLPAEYYNAWKSINGATFDRNLSR